MKYVRSTNASGTQWGNSQIIDAVGDVGIEPSLKIVDGNPAIAYYDNTNGYLKFVRAQDAFGETWNTPVNLEENGDRTPIKYVLPPGIEREVNVGSTNNQQLNEQSLSLKVCNLEDGDARAAYKNTMFDVRNYKKIKM